MSILLPPANHPARELIDVRELAVYFAPENVDKIPDSYDAISKARDNIRSSDGFIRSINVICRIADKEYILINVSLSLTSSAKLMSSVNG